MRVDAHVHVLPPGLAAHRTTYADQDLTFRALYAHPRARIAQAEALVESMDRCGIDRAVLANIGWATPDLCRKTNDYLLEAARRYPDRLLPLCTVNPLMGRDAVAEIERCAALGARGVGELHPDTQGFDLGDAHVMAPVVEAATRLGLPILTHASEPVGHAYPGKGQVTPQVLYRFVTSFPGVPIVLAHWGGGLPFYALMPEVREALASVVFDTAATAFLYDRRVFEVAVGLVGPEKVLFATDFPLLPQRRVLRQVEEADLSPEARAAILGGNAARLFGLT